MGLALSSTAIVMQILEERGETTEPHGQKIFAVLLLQDLAIVPFLAVGRDPRAGGHGGQRHVALAADRDRLGAVVGVVAVGRYAAQPDLPHLRRRPRRAR